MLPKLDGISLCKRLRAAKSPALILMLTAKDTTSDKNGALPGYLMKANPQVGDSYYQEFYPGEAVDEAEVISLDETVSIDFGEFDLAKQVTTKFGVTLGTICCEGGLAMTG